MTPEEALKYIEKWYQPTEPKEREKAIKALSVIIKSINEIRQYRKIGTVAECREAVEKQKPMEIEEIHVDEYYCPACGSENCCDQGIVGDRYCHYCGQAVHQSENLEVMEDE